MIDGHGDPNTSEAYQTALEVLYGLAYAVKMSKMGGRQPKGYYDFVVPPLEGLWSTDTGVVESGITDKSAFCWTSMIRMPEFVTPEVIEEAKVSLSKKRSPVLIYLLCGLKLSMRGFALRLCTPAPMITNRQQFSP